MLECGQFQQGKRPFRFENMWLKAEGFVDQVRQWWGSYQFHGSPSHVLAKKLKALKSDLKKWNVESFGHVSVKMNQLWLELAELDSMAEGRSLSMVEKNQKAQIAMELEKLALLEEISWRQKSRVTWLKEGDKNTKFFHRLANSNRRYNSISTLLINGDMSTDQDAIADHIIQFYTNLYTEESDWRPTLDGLEFSMITAKEALWLERPFDEEEVGGVIKLFNGDKAPGPNGFPMAFFQNCWDVIRSDIMGVMHSFYERGTFATSLNASFLTLIPKKSEAVEVKDFRPISLVGGMYKIIAKVLANRLRIVLNKLVSPSQNAFVQGRQILDLVLIANEVLDSRLKQGIPGVLCKLDIEKAYDHVNWGFLLYLLCRCGFLTQWGNWIGFCISTVRFSILINGCPQGFFVSSRGSRQGDPLSTLLLVLIMEALSRMMVCAIHERVLSGFLVGTDGDNPIVVSHLLFADDTLVFCNADVVQLEALRRVFTWFEVISGLKVNLQKSEMVPVGDVPNLAELVAVLGCKSAALPMIYLGLPLGAKFNSKLIWNPIIEKMESRLGGWKRLYLSKGGKLTLIKSTLSNLPTYFLSLFHLPADVASRLEKIQRDFLWNGLVLRPQPSHIRGYAYPSH
jgi:hypothetical protein